MRKDDTLRDANVRLPPKGVQAAPTKKQTESKAGWGVIVVAMAKEKDVITSIGDVMCGTQTDKRAVPRAEISAMFEALLWIEQYAPKSAHIESTGAYIVGAANEVNKQKKNRAALNEVANSLYENTREV